MSHVPHELSEDFPGKAALLSDLRQHDARVARLMDEYHEVNRTLHRAETDVTPMADDEVTRMRKTRMTLKDEIARILRAAEGA